MAECKLKELCDKFWDWRMKQWPEYATFCGNHDYDDRMNDHSEQGFIRSQATCAQLLAECAQVVTSNLTTSERTTLRMLQWELQSFGDGLEQKAYVFPLSNIDGIHIDFETLTSWMKFNTIDDYAKYVSRLRGLPELVQQDEKMLRLGMETNRTFSVHCVDLVPGQLEELEKPAGNTIFFQPFGKENTFAAQLDSLKDEAKIIIDTKILPAFRQLKKFLVEEYIPACRETAGVCGMNNGKEFYEAVLKWHISTDMTPQEIYDLGQSEVTRIRAEMMEIMKELSYKGSFKEFLDELKANPAMYYKDKEELLADVNDVVSNKIRPVLPNLFKKIPESALTIKSWKKPGSPAAYYLAGTLDGSRQGTFYVNTADLTDSPRNEIISLALHEGEPGHHFQGMYAIEMTGIPSFRRHVEDMYYSIAPSRFSIHTAYAEGWGLYCEYLGKELGLYKDPYSLFGHLSMEMMRACRLVADTGLHAFGWSLEDAVKLFSENTAMSYNSAMDECKRYCTWPGQACAYKVGQIKIKELRQQAREALGEKFTDQDFHEEVLRIGMAPLEVLEEAIQIYIQETAGQQGT